MFGFVMANVEELQPEEKKRYQQVYCGICRGIRERASGTARLALQYDMTFLALLLMSLYEPEESEGKPACGFHPLAPRPYVSNPCIDYAADMNVLLAYYKALDDWQDDKSVKGKAGALFLQKPAEKIAAQYPRQSQAVHRCLQKLSDLEKAGCPEPDGPAGAFGAVYLPGGRRGGLSLRPAATPVQSLPGHGYRGGLEPVGGVLSADHGAVRPAF